ncbi:unnamed protein product, partial [Pelagomonas calceolata]
LAPRRRHARAQVPAVELAAVERLRRGLGVLQEAEADARAARRRAVGLRLQVDAAEAAVEHRLDVLLEVVALRVVAQVVERHAVAVLAALALGRALAAAGAAAAALAAALARARASLPLPLPLPRPRPRPPRPRPSPAPRPRPSAAGVVVFGGAVSVSDIVGFLCARAGTCEGGFGRGPAVSRARSLPQRLRPLRSDLGSAPAASRQRRSRSGGLILLASGAILCDG